VNLHKATQQPLSWVRRQAKPGCFSGRLFSRRSQRVRTDRARPQEPEPSNVIDPGLSLFDHKQYAIHELRERRGLRQFPASIGVDLNMQHDFAWCPAPITRLLCSRGRAGLNSLICRWRPEVPSARTFFAFGGSPFGTLSTTYRFDGNATGTVDVRPPETRPALHPQFTFWAMSPQKPHPIRSVDYYTVVADGSRAYLSLNDRNSFHQVTFRLPMKSPISRRRWSTESKLPTSARPPNEAPTQTGCYAAIAQI